MAEVGKSTGKKTQAGREVYETPDGEMVSEKSTTFKYKGKWINIPTIHNGYAYDDDMLRMMLDAEVIEPTSTHKSKEDAINSAIERSKSLKFNEGGLSSQTEEALGWAAEGKKLAVDTPEVSLRDAATFVAEMTPIIGDALAAKEVYDELQKDEPNYYLAGALGGAAIVGLVPGLGDVAAKAIKKGAREVFDVAKRVEVDPNAMSAFGVGAVKLRPNQADTFEEVMTPVKINKKGVKKTGESILRPTDEVSGRLEPRMSRAMLAETAGSVMPGPGKFFDPSRKGYKGDNFVGMLKDADIELDLEFGNYIMMGKGKPQDVSNKTFENLFVSARPSQKKTTFGKNNKSVARANLYDGPTLTIQDMKSNYKSATGNTGMEVRTNLLQPERFSMVTDEGKRSLDHPIVAVQSMSGKKDHFYTLDTQFVGPVRMDRLTKKVKRTNKDTGKVTEEVPQPNLRPATVGDINLGEQVGTIKVGKKEHPLYDYIEVDATMSAPEGMGGIQKFNQGGKVMNNQMEMAFMKQGGIKDDGMKRDPVSGNEIPPGSMAKEVRDDIPAMLSEGEYVVPADVLRFYGVNFFEDLRNKAKSGLQGMEQNGRIGGEPLSPQQVQQNMGQAPVQANQGGMMQGFNQAGLAGTPTPTSTFDPSAFAVVGGSTFNNQGQQAQQDSVTTFKTFINSADGSTQIVEFVDGKLKNPAMEKFTQPPYYEQGSSALKKAQSQAQASNNDDKPDFPEPSEREDPKDWGLGVDWSDPEAYANTVIKGQMGRGTRSVLQGLSAIAGPLATAAVGAGLGIQALSQVSNLRAAAEIARAQGMDEQAKSIDGMIKDFMADQPAIVDFFDDLRGTSNTSAMAVLDRMGMKYEEDPITKKLRYSPEQLKHNLEIQERKRSFAKKTADETAAIQAGGGATGDDDGPFVFAGEGVEARDGSGVGDRYVFDEDTTDYDATDDDVFDQIDADFAAAGVAQNKGGLMAPKKKKKK